MKKYFTWLTLIFIVACHAKQKVVKQNTTSKEADEYATATTLPESPCQPITEDAEKFVTTKSDPFTLKDARIVKDCLEIDVAYSGGCGEINFNLLWNSMVMKTNPPQINLILSLDDDDKCEALKMRTLSFNLSPFQQYQTDRGFVIRIANFENTLNYQQD